MAIEIVLDELRKRAEELVDDPSDVEWIETIEAALLSVVEDCCKMECQDCRDSAPVVEMDWYGETRIVHQYKDGREIPCHVEALRRRFGCVDDG